MLRAILVAAVGLVALLVVLALFGVIETGGEVVDAPTVSADPPAETGTDGATDGVADDAATGN